MKLLLLIIPIYCYIKLKSYADYFILSPFDDPSFCIAKTSPISCQVIMNTELISRNTLNSPDFFKKQKEREKKE